MPVKKITKQLVAEISKSYTDIKSLNLSNNEIVRIQNLDVLTGLTTLNLAHNHITALENLDAMSSLRNLYVQNNDISHLPADALRNLSNLEVLDLSFNQISEASELQNIKGITSLKWIILEGNPFCSRSNYRPLVCSILPSVETIDYLEVDAQERKFHLLRSADDSEIVSSIEVSELNSSDFHQTSSSNDLQLTASRSKSDLFDKSVSQADERTSREDLVHTRIVTENETLKKSNERLRRELEEWRERASRLDEASVLLRETVEGDYALIERMEAKLEEEANARDAAEAELLRVTSQLEILMSEQHAPNTPLHPIRESTDVAVGVNSAETSFEVFVSKTQYREAAVQSAPEKETPSRESIELQHQQVVNNLHLQMEQMQQAIERERRDMNAALDEKDHAIDQAQAALADFHRLLDEKRTTIEKLREDSRKGSMLASTLQARIEVLESIPRRAVTVTNDSSTDTNELGYEDRIAELERTNQALLDLAAKHREMITELQQIADSKLELEDEYRKQSDRMSNLERLVRNYEQQYVDLQQMHDVSKAEFDESSRALQKKIQTLLDQAGVKEQENRDIRGQLEEKEAACNFLHQQQTVLEERLQMEIESYNEAEASWAERMQQQQIAHSKTQLKVAELEEKIESLLVYEQEMVKLQRTIEALQTKGRKDESLLSHTENELVKVKGDLQVQLSEGTQLRRQIQLLESEVQHLHQLVKKYQRMDTVDLHPAKHVPPIENAKSIGSQSRPEEVRLLQTTVDALKRMLHMQEQFNERGNNDVLQQWREKVLQLLIQQKLNEEEIQILERKWQEKFEVEHRTKRDMMMQMEVMRTAHVALSAELELANSSTKLSAVSIQKSEARGAFVQQQYEDCQHAFTKTVRLLGKFDLEFMLQDLNQRVEKRMGDYARRILLLGNKIKILSVVQQQKDQYHSEQVKNLQSALQTMSNKKSIAELAAVHQANSSQKRQHAEIHAELEAKIQQLQSMNHDLQCENNELQSQLMRYQKGVLSDQYTASHFKREYESIVAQYEGLRDYADQQHQKVLHLEAELERLNREYRCVEKELQAVTDTYQGDFQDSVRKQTSEIALERDNLKRENAKLSLQVRQIEREMSRLADRTEKQDRARFQYLEMKLAETEESVVALRKENNTLQAAVRRLRLQQTQQVRAPEHSIYERETSSGDEKEGPQNVRAKGIAKETHVRRLSDYISSSDSEDELPTKQKPSPKAHQPASQGRLEQLASMGNKKR